MEKKQLAHMGKMICRWSMSSDSQIYGVTFINVTQNDILQMSPWV
jgi:hypothetical protein